MAKIVKFSCHGCHAPAYGCSLPGDNSGMYVLHSDYAALERELTELREAVRWLDETLAMLLTKVAILEAFGTPDDTEEICESFYAARAAVDALVGGE